MQRKERLSDERLRIGTLTDEEIAAIEGSKIGIDYGKYIKRWWETQNRTGTIAKIPVALQPDSLHDINYGFIQDVPLRLGLLPCLGVYQRMLYYQIKGFQGRECEALSWYKQQIREYMFRYILSHGWSNRPRVPPLRDMAQDPDNALALAGWRWEQLFYKLESGDEIHRFSPKERFQIVDLRTIGSTYEWIILRVKLFDFILAKPLFGINGPRAEIPLEQEVYIIINKDFIIEEEDPEPGVVARYGAGWSVLPVPSPESLLAYGPNHLITAYEHLCFILKTDGSISIEVVFISNLPNQILNLRPINFTLNCMDLMSLGIAAPFTDIARGILNRLDLPQVAYDYSLIELLNSISGGEAFRLLDLSLSRAFQDIMVAHFISLYRFLLQTQQLWGRVPDWLDTEEVQRILNQGESHV